jgi:hypothetical protein
VVHDGGAFGVVEALPLGQQPDLVQLVLEEIVALVGEGRAALLLVEREMLVLMSGMILSIAT